MLMLALFAGLAGGCGGGGQGAGGGGGQDGSKITIGYIEWDKDVAVSNLAKVLLEDELGYETELQLLDVGPIFSGVANGELDAFLDVWLPKTHQTYYDEVGDQVVDLGRWYEGTAFLGIGVPSFVGAQTIEDLEDYRDEFGGEIIGIEPGSGVMGVVEEDAIPDYGLDYELIESSTPAMLSQLEQAIEGGEPIALTAWRPHWMFLAYDIRYLEDPQGAMGGEEELGAIARQGLEEDAPDAYELLDNINLSVEQLAALELEIQEAGDPEQGTRNWLDENRETVEPFLPANA